MRNVVRVYKAQAVAGREAPGLDIEVTHPFPDLSPEAGRAIHKKQGGEIADALLASLARGTIDHLLLRLLESRVTELRVPCPSAAVQARDAAIPYDEECDACRNTIYPDETLAIHLCRAHFNALSAFLPPLVCCPGASPPPQGGA